MELYHGTSNISALAIIGPPPDVDVTKGGGELGRGFYLGSEPSLAAALAKGNPRINPGLLKFTIDEAAYVKLNILIIKKRGYLAEKWHRLIRSRTTRTFLYHADVVVAPFAMIDVAHQYKFESSAAETLLNTSDIKKIL